MNVILAHDAPIKEEWYAVARNAGQYVPMFPRRMPLCGSPREAMERIKVTLGRDPEFSAKFDGWHFEPVRYDLGFRHDARKVRR